MALPANGRDGAGAELKVCGFQVQLEIRFGISKRILADHS
jgi:hypothetical protein